MFTAGLACFVAAYGLASAPDAAAATSHAWSTTAGSTCQLSIPTTDTSVRPKATGFRNESTTISNFVICPYSSSITPSGGSSFTALLATLRSIDGVARDVTCTGVVNADGYSGPSVYSSKTQSVGSGGATFSWTIADFGGGSGAIPGSAVSSVTCLLPPQTTIVFVEAAYDYNIGT
jgi:hypothetical protein